VDGRHDWLLQSGIGSEQSFLGMSCPSLCYVGGGPRGGHPTPPRPRSSRAEVPKSDLG
jgi:hypothetical protein